jgi:GMP synthase (glutamine-hydrolysing)
MRNVKQAIAVIDLGGQYCHLISRRLRDLKVRSHIFAASVRASELRHYAGVILSGGHRSVWETGSPKVDPNLLKLNIPVLGICYGHQLLAELMGATVTRGESEFGPARLRLDAPDSLFLNTPAEQTVWMSHSDSVSNLPHGATILARTSKCHVAAFAWPKRRLFGVQFHPEVVHTAEGTEVLRNFTKRICRVTKELSQASEVEVLVEEIRQKVGNNSVFFFVSGGVDSTVAFTLCAKALPKDRLLGVYVDTGLMREGETAEFYELIEHLDIADRVRVLNKKKTFLDNLSDEIDPEKKRQIIGRTFVEVQQAVMREYGIDEEHWMLGQGTIYPDTIESGGTTGAADVIKTHHNRCEEIRHLIERGRVIEPLREFYKDEVRKLGECLGLSRHLTQRWPFPGPGLAIRCLCNDKIQRAEGRELLPPGFEDYEGVRFPIRSVGVQGDGRTYRFAVALKGPADYERLQELSTDLCSTGTMHNRVIFYICGKVIDLTAAVTKPVRIDDERLSRLRQADHIVRTVMEEKGLLESVWQFPVVLIPVSFGSGESIVLRPVNSQDGMTANFARLQQAVIEEIATRIVKEVPEIDAVFLDVTDKPPATIEWE